MTQAGAPARPAFAALAAYLLVQSTVVLATGFHPRH
jgi:hypothetical protein